MGKYTRTKVSCYIGYIVQAVINNFLPLLFLNLQTDYGISYEMLGRLIFFNFCVQIAVDILSVKIVKYLGYRKTIILAHLCAAAGLVMLGVLPMVWKNVYAAIMVSIFVYAAGSGIIEVILSPLIEYLPSENKGGSMCFLHSFYCWGQVLTVIVTTVLLKTVFNDNWMLLSILWAAVPFINMFSFINAPLVIPAEEREHKTMSMRELLRDKKIHKLMIFMLCAGASEMAMAQWSSMFAEQALGVSKVLGDLLGPCAFAIFMGTGRIVYGSLGKRISMNRLLFLNAILCTACYLIVALAKAPVFCLVACALCGFSVSLMWPGTYTYAAKIVPLGGTAMYGILALCGDLGCSVGPWLTGVVADFSNLPTGFLVTAIFPIALSIATGFNEIKSIKQNTKE